MIDTKHVYYSLGQHDAKRYRNMRCLSFAWHTGIY